MEEEEESDMEERINWEEWFKLSFLGLVALENFMLKGESFIQTLICLYVRFQMMRLILLLKNFLTIWIWLKKRGE